MPLHESSQVRSAQRARSKEGMEQVANPTAARRSWPRWSSTLLDHLVSPLEQRLGDRQPERLRGLQVDHQLELRRLLDRQIRGLRASKDPVDVDSGPPEL